MVVVADVDGFLSKTDFLLLHESVWPWAITHFIIVNKCYGCKSPITLVNAPCHFIVSDSTKVIKLINYSFFWCPQCKFYAVYDHYCEDECDYCH